jgi:hypothetical protein
VAEHPLLPNFGGPCVTGIIPALFGPGGTNALPAWFPVPVAGAAQVVLLVLDGLGWEQLQARRMVAPVLAGLSGGPVTTVAPSTTATALTSITTGLPPGEHGVVGYRVDERGEVLNILRWSTPRGDARTRIEPGRFQSVPPFFGTHSPVVTKAEFHGSGFTGAHLAGTRLVPWRVTSTLVVEVRRLLAAGEPFVYAYYDGVDKVAHEYGLEGHFDAEVAAADRLVTDLLEVLPAGAALLVTADHGQVHVGDRTLPPAPEVLARVASQSGEGRFRWLHARPGAAGDLLATAGELHGDVAWVVSRDEVVDGGWFGPTVGRDALRRLGDVALVPFAPVSFEDPADSGPFNLIGRHGSLTSAEMLVPLVAGRAS